MHTCLVLLWGAIDHRVYNIYLQEVIQSSADRLAKLAAKWEEVRGPLIERYRTLKGDSENKESETNLLLEEIKLLRERMKEVADETRLKDDLYKQLVSGELESNG